MTVPFLFFACDILNEGWDCPDVEVLLLAGSGKGTGTFIAIR